MCLHTIQYLSMHPCAYMSEICFSLYAFAPFFSLSRSLSETQMLLLYNKFVRLHAAIHGQQMCRKQVE